MALWMDPDRDERSPIDVAGVSIKFDGALESVSEYGGGGRFMVVHVFSSSELDPADNLMTIRNEDIRI